MASVLGAVALRGVASVLGAVACCSVGAVGNCASLLESSSPGGSISVLCSVFPVILARCRVSFANLSLLLFSASAQLTRLFFAIALLSADTSLDLFASD